MTFAQGSRSALSYQLESSFGTSGSPALISLPYKTFSLNLQKELVQGNDLIGDRIPRISRHGNRSVAGDLTVDLRKGDYDSLIQTAMLSTWSTNTISPGVTTTSLTIESELPEAVSFRLFTGVMINTMAVSIRPNQMVEATFGMIGKNMTHTGTSFDATKTAASANAPFDAYSGALRIADFGGALAANTAITGIDFTLDNGLEAAFVVGSSTTPQVLYGQATVTGTITAYVEDRTLVDRFLNEVTSQMDIEVDDPTGANPYTFFFPKIKINTADIAIDGPGGVLVSMGFDCLYDDATDKNFKITRTNP